MKTQRPYVALMLRTSAKTYREALNSILRYNHCIDPWSLLIIQARNTEDPRAEPSTIKLAGAIIDETMKDYRRIHRFKGIPLVTIESVPPSSLDNPFRIHIVCDNERIGQAAAQHLLKLGHTNFAYVPDRLNEKWSALRGKSFSKELLSAGKKCRMFTPPPRNDPNLGDKDFTALCDWVKTLQKPCALFAANDLRARNVLDAAMHAGISVPGELSILGCDDEEILCVTAKPKLSSIKFDIEEVAFSAARALDRMIKTGNTLPRSERVMRYGPSVIVKRKSTDRPFTQDPLAEKAISYIQLNAIDGFEVSELAKELGVSRRTLEKRFKLATGNSPYDEAIRYRIDLACRMLSDGKLKTSEIAEQCGFPSQSHFETMFKRKLGTTVAQYRNRSRI